jgi:hypothetical protein
MKPHESLGFILAHAPAEGGVGRQARFGALRETSEV